MLGVTLQTVRRDVQRLADEGLLARFHGGVRGAELDHREHRLPAARDAARRRQGAHRARGGGPGAERLLADPQHRHHHRGDRQGAAAPYRACA